MLRVPVQPNLLNWALQRSGYTVDSFAETYPDTKIAAWIAGTIQPTLKQLEKFATRTRAPIGYFFLPEPPEEPVPIPDFRTIADRAVATPSPDLLDTIYLCQQRQEWFREYARAERLSPVEAIGSVDRRTDPVVVARQIRETLNFSLQERRTMGTWTEALRRFIEQVEDAGILVMISGVVGSNNTRTLDTAEFRGFALADPFAPLIFINGADTKSAQMFTLAHELAHLWLGQTALSDASARNEPDQETELWCNRVAAELLVPLEAVREQYRATDEVTEEIKRLARVFKVSTLVVLRRIYDAGFFSRDIYWAVYDAELARLRQLAAERPGGGGNFYYTTVSRVSRRFAQAIIGSTLEGRASFTEALRLLGFKKMTTFNDLGRAVGVDI
ncbi:MAG: ImmA/IrrE family metallo-endopeptidase [Phycisphaerales bacterium JB065]